MAKKWEQHALNKKENYMNMKSNDKFKDSLDEVIDGLVVTNLK